MCNKVVEICETISACAPAAFAMLLIRTITSSALVTIALRELEVDSAIDVPDSTRVIESLIKLVVSAAASWLLAASERTSSATTAKPLPC